MTTLFRDFVGARPPVFRTVLVKVAANSNRATVCPPWQTYAHFGILAAVLTGLLAFAFAFLLEVKGVTNLSQRPAGEANILITLSAWVFPIIPLLILFHLLFYKFPRRVQFDRANGMMTVRHSLRLPKQYQLRSLAGLQVCAKFFHGHGGLTPAGPGYDAYELNAVFSEGHEPRRVRIMAHGDYNNFIKDATTLANFLGVPLIRSDQ